MDTVGDFLSQIKNGFMAGKKQVRTPASKLRLGLAKILASQGFLGDVKEEKIDKTKKELVVDLVYDEKERPIITEIKRVSTPGRRIYVTADKIPYVLGGQGVVVLSTSKGLMVGREAREKNLGGEVICTVY